MLTQRTSLFSLAAAALMLLAGSAHAGTLNVPSVNYPTIQSAINVAAPGDTILVAAGTYRESLHWVNKDLTIAGAGASQSIIDPSAVNGGPGGRCIYTTGLTPASRIEGFTIQGGYQGVDHNSDNYQGGGMFNDASSPTVANCTFSGNFAWDGGGIMSRFCSLTVTGCTFIGNRDGMAGGAAMFTYGDATVTDCTFTGNSTDNISNLSITMENVGNVTVTGCTFSNNQGVSMYSYGDATVSGCSFTGNTSGSTYPGGIYARGTARVTDCAFIGNSGQRAGGISLDRCNGTVTGCKFEENRGAIEAIENSSLTATGCTFNGNSENALFNFESSATLTNCTLTRNSGFFGGAIWNSSGSSLTLTNCTLTGNSGDLGGAICNGDDLFTDSTPRLTVTNSILRGNAAGDGLGIHTGSEGITTVRNTDIQDLSNTTPDVNGNFSADPLFVRNPNLSTGDYGDLRLRSTSPCINRGNNTVVTAPPFLMDPTNSFVIDLDGNSRLFGGTVDLGAYEAQDSTPPVITVPSNVIATATRSAGAVVTFSASATDDVDGTVPVTCTPPSGSTFAPGKTTVTDAAGNTATATFVVWVQYAWSGVLQPINADGSSVHKAGSTVPVKFALTGASAGITNLQATLSFAKLSNGNPGAINAAGSNGAASSGNLFRYDASSGQYLFNWSTKGLTGTYRLYIDMGDGVLRKVDLGLK